MSQVDLTFRSRLAAPPERVWWWVTSVAGITRELSPLLTMTVPRRVVDIRDLQVVPGRRLFRSQVRLFGILPIDYSDLTLITFDEGKGFVEQSPMRSMKLWRHERRLEPAGRDTILTDRLTFEPRFATALTRWFIQTVFTHRHAVLRRHFGERAE